MASFIEWFAEEAKRAYGETIPSPSRDPPPSGHQAADRRLRGDHPLEFPTAMITRKVAPPSRPAARSWSSRPSRPRIPRSPRELAREAGLPQGVYSVITGPPAEIGAEMTGNRPCASSASPADRDRPPAAAPVRRLGQKVALELGGNAPFIIFEGRRPGRGVEGVMASKFRNTGQTCVCANRIFVQEGIYDALVKKLSPLVAALKSRRRVRAGRAAGPVDRRLRGGEGRGPYRRRRRKGSPDHRRRKTASPGGHFFRADHPDRATRT